MTTSINFTNKSEVYAHHLSVPHHELIPDKAKSVGKADMSDNLIIHGDNLLALKSLLPRYEGKIKCIYIDPPYNTGKEDWIYNDNVNSPGMRDWLGSTVDIEDQERHSKWLCMMWPRLQLLRELLADDGVIFISIDDNEQHHLKCIMDEIFGGGGGGAFIANLVWHRKDNASFLSKKIVTLKEYILFYQKSNNFSGTTDKPINTDRHRELINISNKVQDRVLSRKAVLFMNGEYTGYIKKGRYGSSQFEIEVLKPFSIKEGKADQDIRMRGRFSWSQDKIDKEIKLGGKIEIKTIDGFKPIFIKNYNETDISSPNSYRAMIDILSKKFDKRIATTHDATNTLKNIFNKTEIFPNSKPFQLILHLISNIVKFDKDSIILDSFAGSGTTAHAVMALNKEDGGNRKFILIEGEDYADEITAERVRRVIKGVPKAKDENLRKGLGGSFTYCRLGEAIDFKKIITGERLPTYNQLARLLFSQITGNPLSIKKQVADKSTWFVGETSKYKVHVIYDNKINFLQSNDACLTSDLLKRISRKLKKRQIAIIFAAGRYVGYDDLKKSNALFFYIPHEIHRYLDKK